MAEILGLCSKPKNKTHVMYGTNLSWKMLQQYLSELQSRELLEEECTSKTYITTKRGHEFVEKWKELQKLL
jgi:predicted transcriptional regulator